MQNFTLISNRGNKKLSSHDTAQKFDKRSFQKCPVNHYHCFENIIIAVTIQDPLAPCN